MQIKQDIQKRKITSKINKNPSVQLKRIVFLEETERNMDKLDQLFLKFDKNKNNYLSIEQVLEGCINILNLQQFYFRQKIIQKAFKRSRSLAVGQSRWQSKFINKGFEFKHFFQFLVKITAYWFAFNQIGGSQDCPVQKKKFESSVQIMKKWTVKQDNQRLKLQFVSIEKAFQYLDRNHNGKISLDEFIQFGFEYELQIQISQ